MQSDQRLRFFVFTCRDPKTDFRWPLVEALREKAETYYIWLKRRPLISGPDNSAPAQEVSLPDLLAWIRRFRTDGFTHIYFNSTNTYFPGMTMLLKLLAPRGIWCLDMHDDLRYHNEGFKRFTEDLIIKLLSASSDFTVHAAPTLQEMFPHSHHLGNASHILPLSHDGAPDDAVLVIASFDERFDFDFLEALTVLCPTLTFHLHGWTRPGDTATAHRLAALDAARSNVVYHGAYAMQDLPRILGAYRVTVAPYKMRSPLTRYIDPLRFYHCLNAGLEVISTEIPQADYMRRCIHVVSDPRGCAEALEAVLQGRARKQSGYEPITWNRRADQLLEILQRSPR